MEKLDSVANALQSLASIKKIDDYGMFQMTYFGDYGFDEYLQVGTSIDTKYPDISQEPNITGSGCTVFTTHNSKGDILLCRNYDWSYLGRAYTPSLQLQTRPKNGYSSVSTVNLMFCGYGENYLPSGLSLNSLDTLYAPYLPMDGLNAKGVAIAVLSVPEAKPPFTASKVTLTSVDAIRLVLDKAESVTQAVELLDQYNIFFPYDVYCQYFIADRSGQSVIVNFADGKMRVSESDKPYQIASNQAASDYPTVDSCAGTCWRYDSVKEALAESGGILNEKQAINLLEKVGHINDGQNALRWTVIYNLTTLDGIIFANRKKDSLINFCLN